MATERKARHALEEAGGSFLDSVHGSPWHTAPCLVGSKGETKRKTILEVHEVQDSRCWKTHLNIPDS